LACQKELNLDSKPSGASVHDLNDSKLLGKTPLVLKIEKKAYHLSFELEGYQSEVRFYDFSNQQEDKKDLIEFISLLDLRLKKEFYLNTGWTTRWQGRFKNEIWGRFLFSDKGQLSYQNFQGKPLKATWEIKDSKLIFHIFAAPEDGGNHTEEYELHTKPGDEFQGVAYFTDSFNNTKERIPAVLKRVK